MSASSMEYQFYQGGYFDCTDCIGIINHSMSIVGYKKTKDFGYFILKNSRGT